MYGIEVLTSRTDCVWSERCWRAMGSDAHLAVGDAPAGVVEWGVEEVERLEHAWSRFRPDGELARVHAHPGQWVRVSHAMLLALTCAADLYNATGGAFDPTIRDALEVSGYDRTFAFVDRDNSDALQPAAPVPGFGNIELDTDARAIRLPRGTRIDLGGVGKGLATDLIARGIVERGARSAIVGLGGDVRACGEPPGRGWTIPVIGPFDEHPAFHQTITTGAIVQSSTRLRSWTRNGRRLHHIIDPTTGEPADRGVVAVVATAAEAWWAEGIAKAVIVAGVSAARRFVAEARVHAWAFRCDHSVVELGRSA